MLKAKFDCSSAGKRRTNSWRMGRFFLSALVVFLALTMSIRTVSAHGIGSYLIRGAAAGTYRVHVWNSPAVFRIGSMHLDTVVLDATGKPALSTMVLLRMIPLEGNNTLTIMPGPPAKDYPYMRGAVFSVYTPGEYRLEIDVSDNAGSVATTSVIVKVQTVGTSFKLSIVAIGTLIGGFGLWLLYQASIYWIKSTPTRKARA